MNAEARLTALGMTLPSAPPPTASYVSYRIAGDLLFVAGQGPRRADGSVGRGRVGDDVSLEAAREHARVTGLNLLAVVRDALGSLDRVVEVVKLLGLVRCTAEFTDTPKVIDGCSDLLVDVFGEAGRHARSAIGVYSLPSGITVEVEGIFRIDSGTLGEAAP